KTLLRERAAWILCQRASARCVCRSFRVQKLPANQFVRRAGRSFAVQNRGRNCAGGKEIHATGRETVRSGVGRRQDWHSRGCGLERCLRSEERRVGKECRSWVWTD